MLVDEQLAYTGDGSLASRWLRNHANDEGQIEAWAYSGLRRVAAELTQVAIPSPEAAIAVGQAPTRHGGLRSPVAHAARTMRAFDRTELGTLVAESLDGIEVFSASTAADGASLASVATAPTKWHETGELLDWADAEHGVAAEGWTADGLPTMIAALEGTGPPVAGEERLYDALGRAVAVRTTTPTGGASTVFHAWWGDTILSEEWAEGWRRDWYPGLGLDAPLGYRLDCSAGNCGMPPLGLGVEGAGFDANEPAAVFWTIQEQPSTGPGGAGAQGGSSDLPQARRGPRRRRHRRRDGRGGGALRVPSLRPPDGHRRGDRRGVRRREEPGLRFALRESAGPRGRASVRCDGRVCYEQPSTGPSGAGAQGGRIARRHAGRLGSTRRRCVCS